jgi:DNA-binding transcriptional regulator YhcF (GntR family)
MNQGFILLHRQLLDWEWYDHLPTKVLFIHCLLRANHSKGSWRGQSYERGEFITSIHGLAVETGLSVKQVRTALENLTESKELGKRSTSLNTVISVLNYDFYQSVGKPNGTQKASKGQAKGKQGANEGQQINNENNVNNENNETNEDIPQCGFSFKNSLIELGIEKQIIEDWLKVRKNKKAANTQTAFDAIVREIKKSGMTPNECIKKSVENSWSGFKNELVKPEPVKKIGYPPFKIAL